MYAWFDGAQDIELFSVNDGDPPKDEALYHFYHTHFSAHTQRPTDFIDQLMSLRLSELS